jgi:predicted transcriptional regulator
MARGPRITQEEINKAKALKAEGKKVSEIALEMKRSEPTVYKMLKPLERPEV